MILRISFRSKVASFDGLDGESGVDPDCGFGLDAFMGCVVGWCGRSAFHFPCILAFFNEFPEVFVLGEDLILAGIAKVGSEEEVGKGIFMEDAVDDDIVVGDLEIDAQVFGAEAEKGFAALIQTAELIAAGIFEVTGGDFEFGEQFELSQGIQLADFSGADLVEDNLEHVALMGWRRAECKGAFAWGEMGGGVSGWEVVALDAWFGEVGEDFPWDGIGFRCQFRGRQAGLILLADDDDGIAGCRGLRQIGGVDEDLVHGDAPEDGAALAMDEDAGIAAADRAGQAIGIANGDGGDAGMGLAAGEEGAAVGDAITGRDVADEGDPAFEAEDGLEDVLPFLDRGFSEEGESGADEGGVAAGKSEKAGAVGEVDVRGQGVVLGDVVEEGVEMFGLLAGEGAVFVCGRVMAGEAIELQPGAMPTDVVEEGEGFAGQCANAPHAGVDDDVHGQGWVAGIQGVVEDIGFVAGRDRGGEAELGDDSGFFGESGAEQEDGHTELHGIDTQGFVQAGDTEELDVRGEGFGHGFEAVAIGIGLDDRDAADRASGKRACPGLDGGEVMAEGGEIDLRPDAVGAGGLAGDIPMLGI